MAVLGGLFIHMGNDDVDGWKEIISLCINYANNHMSFTTLKLNKVNDSFFGFISIEMSFFEICGI
jgi:hypothetical protein